jgi:hypothetical protein
VIRGWGDTWSCKHDIKHIYLKYRTFPNIELVTAAVLTLEHSRTGVSHGENSRALCHIDLCTVNVITFTTKVDGARLLEVGAPLERTLLFEYSEASFANSDSLHI